MNDKSSLESQLRKRIHELEKENEKLREFAPPDYVFQSQESSSAERFRVLFKHSAAGILISSPNDYKIIDINNAALKMLGYEREELIGKTYLAFTKSENIPHYKELPGKLLRGEIQFYKVEREFLRKDGTVIFIHVHVSALTNENNKITEVISIIDDITDLKTVDERLRKSEESLRDSENFLNETGEIAKVGGWSLDVSTGKGKWTEALYHIYGMEPGTEPTIDGTLHFYSDEVRHLVPEAFQKAIRDGENIDMELPITDAKGRRKWIYVIGRPVYENGVVTKLMGALMDITDRKELQMDLEATLTALPDMLFELNEKGTIIDYYAPDSNNLNLQLAEFINKSIYEISQPENADIIRDKFEKFINDGLEERILYPLSVNGAVNWYEMAIAEKTDYSHDERRFICLLRDITDRIKTEKELLESRELLRETGRMAKVGGWAVTLGSEYVIWNDEIKRLHEVDENFKPKVDEAVNFYHPEDRPVISEAVTGALDSGEPFDLVLRIITARQNLRWVHAIGRAYFENDILAGAKGTVQDITDRKNLEIELHKSNERWMFALESAGDGLWDWDLTTNEVYYSESWKKLLGFEKEHLKYNRAEWEKRIHPEDIDNTISDIKAHIEGRQPQYVNLHRIKGADDNYQWILARGKIIERDENGNPLRLIGTITDMNERITMEEELRESEASLRELIRTKDKLFSILAHDLRNPMQGIIGSATGVLKKNADGDSKGVAKFGETIKKAAFNALNIFEDLMIWSRAQNANLSIDPSEIDVSKLIESLLDIMQPSAENKNIKVHTHFPESLTLRADKQMLHTILRNLLSNAIKFTKSGGEVNLRIIENENNYLFSSVDNGIGIEQSRITKIFFVGESTSTKGTHNEPGTGLGLIVCKEFINKHGGKIWVESRVGEGTTVSFSIPKRLPS